MLVTELSPNSLAEMNGFSNQIKKFLNTAGISLLRLKDYMVQIYKSAI